MSQKFKFKIDHERLYKFVEPYGRFWDKNDPNPRVVLYYDALKHKLMMSVVTERGSLLGSFIKIGEPESPEVLPIEHGKGLVVSIGKIAREVKDKKIDEIIIDFDNAEVIAGNIATRGAIVYKRDLTKEDFS